MALNGQFNPEVVNQIARESGFLKRLRKLSPYGLICALIGTRSMEGKVSLLEYVNDLDDYMDIEITKQSLDAKFSESGVRFARELFEHISKIINKEEEKSGKNVIKLKDSTSFQCPSSMSADFPGTGGGGSKAGMKLQYEADFRGRIYDLDIGAMTSSDSTDSQTKTDELKPGDLLIRDLGYVSIKALEALEKKLAFYIYRLNNSNIYRKVKGKYIRLEYQDLYDLINSEGRLEIEVYLTKKYFRTRLVADIVPQEVYQKRVDGLRKSAKKKGFKVEKKNLVKQRMNLFITNTDIDAEEIRSIYRLRWQVELVFKSWKSYENLDEIKEVKQERVLMELYAKLIWLAIKGRVEAEIAEWGRENGNPLSLTKIRQNLAKYAKSVWDGFTWMFEILTKKISRFNKRYKREVKKGKDGQKHDCEKVLKKLKNTEIKGLDSLYS